MPRAQAGISMVTRAQAPAHLRIAHHALRMRCASARATRAHHRSMRMRDREPRSLRRGRVRRRDPSRNAASLLRSPRTDSVTPPASLGQRRPWARTIWDLPPSRRGDPAASTSSIPPRTGPCATSGMAIRPRPRRTCPSSTALRVLSARCAVCPRIDRGRERDTSVTLTANNTGSPRRTIDPSADPDRA